MENSTVLFVSIKQSDDDGNEMPLTITRYWAAFLMLTAGLSGLTANVFAIRLIRKSSMLPNCFGLLLIFQAITSGGILIGFVFWAVPMTITASEFSYSYFGYKVGHLMIYLHLITLIIQITKSINRFLAIVLPLKYKVLCAKENFIFIVIPLIIFPFCCTTIYFFNGCNFFFDGPYMAWAYDNNWCFELLIFYLDFLTPLIVMSIVVLIDLLTCGMIFKTNASKKSKRDVKFFIQTLTISLVYIISIVIIQICVRFPVNPVVNFFMVTFNWELCHVIEGVLMLTFNFHSSKIVKVTTLSTINLNLQLSLVTKVHSKNIIRSV